MKIINSYPEISFNDVLLLPQRSGFAKMEERKETDLKTKVSQHISLDIPLASAPIPSITGAEMAIAIGKLGGIGFLTFLQTYESQIQQLKKVKAAGVKVAVSMYLYHFYTKKKVFLNHIKTLLEIGADMICFESDHIGNDPEIYAFKDIRKRFPKAELCVSLLVTGVETRALIKAGANSIRVGIGAGSHCTTRRVTGVGRPQLSAIEDCYNVAQKYDVPIISDCGVKTYGDVAKGLVFGASVMVMGGMLAGSEECPGEVVIKKGKKYKYTWGTCTRSAHTLGIPTFGNWKEYKAFIKQSAKRVLGVENTSSEYADDGFVSEGVEKFIPYRGPVTPTLMEIVGALRRSMWYQGAHTIDELRENAKVVRVSPGTFYENNPTI